MMPLPNKKNLTIIEKSKEICIKIELEGGIMNQISSINFTDLDSGDHAYISIRSQKNMIALCLSLENSSDVEVFFNLETCDLLLKALQDAKSTLTL